MEDRSLDEFLNGDDGSVADDESTGRGGESAGDGDGSAREGGTVGDRDAEDGEDREPAVEPGSRDGVEPAETTAAWDPDGAECEACGAAVRRRWQGEDGLVCGECKEW